MRARTRAREIGRSDTQLVTTNGIARAQSVDTQQITTNDILLLILHVSSLISNGVFNTDTHRQ